jgi:hypothetical protein
LLASNSSIFSLPPAAPARIRDGCAQTKFAQDSRFVRNHALSRKQRDYFLDLGFHNLLDVSRAKSRTICFAIGHPWREKDTSLTGANAWNIGLKYWRFTSLRSSKLTAEKSSSPLKFDRNSVGH